jgi:hypothetical protein
MPIQVLGGGDSGLRGGADLGPREGADSGLRECRFGF